ncbi:hypothetical protein [Kribbella pratensis]|uniref:hypothetical protein n=1 Tax=Kribbella pratensis TaxID=2512112 RepID=UPI001066709F|nr:hypothetical protein [Kribbella pratensis]
MDALLRRAEAMAESRAADETELAHHSVAARLASPEYDNQRRVRVWAQQVELRLPASDSEYLRRITELRRREVASEINRKIEQEQRAYLRDDVLASPGSTTVWWLNQNLDQVDRAVELFGTFANLSAAAHDRHETTSIGSEAGFGARRDEAALAGLSSIRDEDPTTAPRMGGNASNGWSTAEDASAGTIQVRMDFDAAVERLLDDHPEPERSLKADSLAMLETRFGRPDRADRIRELFDTPGEPSSSSALGDSSSGPTSALPSTVSTTSANPAGAESSAATAPSGADPFEIVEASTDAPTTVQEPHGAAPLTVEDTSRPEAIATVPFTSAADVASTGRPGIEQRAAAEYREQFYSSGESTIVPSDADHPTEESGHSDPNG